MATINDPGRIGVARYFVDQWGGNPSTVSYAQAITSHQVAGQWWQYAAWYGPDTYVRIARRNPADVWETAVMPDMRLEVDDAHNGLAWGISRSDGRLHLVAGPHGDPIQYTVSSPGVADDTPPWSAGLFGPTSSTLLGVPIGTLSLVNFTPKPDGGLLCWWRNGGSGNGRLRLAEYEDGAWTVVGDVTASTGNWTAPNGVVSTRRNLYWAPPLYGHGVLHLAGHWREGTAGILYPSTAPMANHNIVYAYSEDHGRTWHNGDGLAIATTGSDPIAVTDPGIHVPGLHAYRNAMQMFDMAVGPNGLIGFLPDYVDPALLTAANGAATPGYVTNLAERDKWASEHPRWRTPPASGWAGGTWSAVSLKIGGKHLFNGWPPGRHTCTRGKMAFHPTTGDMVVIHSGLLVASARASTGYTDWTLDVPSGAGFGDLMIDRSREAEGRVSVLTIEQAPPGATSAAVLVRDIEL